jgi:ribosomal protein L35
MHGPKPKKGLLKRVRLTKSGKVKVRRSHGRHLRSHKSGDLLRSYRKAQYAPACDLDIIGKMLNVRLKPGGTPRKPEPEAAAAATGAPATKTAAAKPSSKPTTKSPARK